MQTRKYTYRKYKRNIKNCYIILGNDKILIKQRLFENINLHINCKEHFIPLKSSEFPSKQYYYILLKLKVSKRKV